MDFRPSEEQAMLKDGVRRYAERACGVEVLRRLRERGGFDAERWAAIAGMGWLAAGLAESAGGLGGGLVDESALLEEVGRGLVPEPVLACGLLPVRLLDALPGSALRDDLQTAVLSGARLLAIAHGEPAARGRPAFVEARAERIGRGYRLRGHKSRVVGGSVAHGFLLSARHGGEAADAMEGLALFHVDRSLPGLKKTACRLVDGTPAADLEFDLEVPAEARLAVDAGAGLVRMQQAGALGACAEMVGAMEQALWITRDYLCTRKQFGVAIGTFQALQHRMADGYMALEQARSILFRALSFAEEPDAAVRGIAIAAAKSQVGRCAQQVAALAVQLHGGIGVTDESIVGHYFKRLLVLEAAFGSSAFHLAVVARSLRAAA